jgi:hypothetical protein
VDRTGQLLSQFLENGAKEKAHAAHNGQKCGGINMEFIHIYGYLVCG